MNNKSIFEVYLDMGKHHPNEGINQRKYNLINASPNSPLVLTCEHATAALPAGIHWHEDDRWMTHTHWAFDIGAAEITTRLAQQTASPAILGTTSRLYLDLNRPIGADTMFRKQAEGRDILLNMSISTDEAQRRIEGYYHPYHQALDGLVRDTKATLCFSVHTFTPLYEGERRELEIGVLHAGKCHLAEPLAEAFTRSGYKTKINEPWSGTDGMMFSVNQVATKHNRDAIEIEIRQDLSIDETTQSDIVDILSRELLRLPTVG